ncbi:MAG: SusC/RagA family TonB-linked outer membrane protein [Bacteroidota bacterium]|nr:SusC/RagA family TonB-linked outer membrane protein [Bacteroidota bacterium]
MKKIHDWERYVQYFLQNYQILVIMKLTVLLICLFSLSVQATGYSQSARVNLNIKEVSLKELFKLIEEQTQCRFFYNDQFVSLDKKVSFKANSISVDEVLNVVLKDANVTHKVLDNNLVVITPIGNQAKNTISGTVTDAKTGESLPGVSVLIKGTYKGTVTDQQGKFSFTNSDHKVILVVSYMGYEKQEITVDSYNPITIRLAESVKTLEEVVVVGYGTRKKSDVTGAITSISAQSLADVPSANLSQALQGQGAGIDVQKSNGNSKPGQAPTILIRGTRSVKAGNSPLVVIDGIAFDGNINDFNIDDIASVEVLKDASSTAIYGSRGANGVILVTTKHGKSGMRQPLITYSGYTGFNKNIGEYPMMNGQQYLLLKKWAKYIGNPGKYSSIDDPQIIADAFSPEEQQGIAIGRNTDWQKLVYKTGITTNHQISVTGGTDATQYAISGGYYNETGVYFGQSFKRYSLKLSFDQQLTKFLKVGINSFNTYSITQGENQNPMGQALRASPLASPYDTTGVLINYFVPGSSNQVWNPLANFIDGAVVENRKRLGTFTTFYLEANIFNGLKYKFNAGAQLKSDVYGNFYTSQTTNNLGGPSSANNQTGISSNYTLENIVTYDKIIAKKHNINFTGLLSFEDNVSESNSFNYTGLLSDNTQYFNPSLGANLSGTGSRAEYALLSYMARVNYSYNDKYLLTLAMRTDASSRLAEGNKFHTFPSAAIAWNINKESFLQNSSFISNLKLRVSYGSVGNTSISPYQTLGSLTNQVYNYGSTNTTGLYPNSVPNPTLGWEYTSTLNAGVDFGFWQNRISGSVELYHSYTNDMMLPQSLPATSGIPNTILTNIGKSENKGIEIHISSVNIQSNGKNGITWTSDFNFFINRGQITQLNPSLNTFYNGKPADIGNKWFVGQPIGSFYDYQKIGIWQATSADTLLAKSLGLTTTGTGSVIGQIRVADRNKNGQIDAGDMYIIGSPQPKWEGGTTQKVSFKNFDFTVAASARFGSTISSTLYGGGFANTLQANYNNINIDYWTLNNPTNEWPKPNSAQTNPAKNSTLGYFDGSFLKIRSLSLGYSIPQSILRSTGMKSVRIYATANDPFILFSPYRDKFHGLDPETSGTLNVDTPATWSMIFGINIIL